jgi:hypothetical protein
MLIGSIVALILAAILFLGFFLLPSLATAQQQQQQTTTTTSSPSSSLSVTTTPPLTPQEQEQQNRLQNVIASTTLNLQETEKQANGIVFTPRWSQPVWVNANSVSVLVAYCLPGEFAESGQEILGGFGLEVLESYAIALPQGFMAWMAVVGNQDEENVRLPAALGVICASDLNNAEARVLSPEEQQQINNINQQFVNIQNTQITDIDNVINVINNITTNGTTSETETPQPPLPTGNDTGGGGIREPLTEECPIGTFFNRTSGQCEFRGFPDVIGNTTVVQADTTPPVVVVARPDSLTFTTDNPEGTAALYEVVAEDNVDGSARRDASNNLRQDDDVGGAITISCNPPSFSVFPVGVTTVQCTAVDEAGNVGTTSFPLTIELVTERELPPEPTPTPSPEPQPEPTPTPEPIPTPEPEPPEEEQPEEEELPEEPEASPANDQEGGGG